MPPEIGFVGVGVMGQPMSANLLRAGTRLIVWNRSPERCEPLRALGATVAADVAEVFDRAGTVILMLFDLKSIDSVLRRGTTEFAAMVRDRTIVNMGSIAPDDSRALEVDVRAAGGRYVEAPVSGSRVPAERGELVAMVAGERRIVEDVRPLLAPMCREQVYCGPVGSALLMKLAVNLFMLVMVNGLVEAVHFADRLGLERSQFQAVVNTSQMASGLSRVKLEKIVAADYSAQATVADALNATHLITTAAGRANAACDLIRICQARYEEAAALGPADDMSAVIRALEARSNALAASKSAGSRTV